MLSFWIKFFIKLQQNSSLLLLNRQQSKETKERHCLRLSIQNCTQAGIYDMSKLRHSSDFTQVKK